MSQQQHFVQPERQAERPPYNIFFTPTDESHVVGQAHRLPTADVNCNAINPAGETPALQHLSHRPMNPTL